MKRIYKYPLMVIDDQFIDLPVCAQLLSVMNQNDTIVLYAMVEDTEMNIEQIKIRIFGTGNLIIEHSEHRLRFVGTVPLHDGKLVFHVFVEGTPILKWR